MHFGSENPDIEYYSGNGMNEWHLEYASSVWNSISMQHDTKLEGIYKPTVTKMVVEIRTMKKD